MLLIVKNGCKDTESSFWPYVREVRQVHIENNGNIIILLYIILFIYLFMYFQVYYTVDMEFKLKYAIVPKTVF